jgi:hypothetical protein
LQFHLSSDDFISGFVVTAYFDPLDPNARAPLKGKIKINDLFLFSGTRVGPNVGVGITFVFIDPSECGCTSVQSARRE